MTDVFVSYANEDRARAKVFAQAIEAQGWSVWWDRKIPFGRVFDEVIAEHLAAARCVLVLWTRNSVESRWVRAEASEAATREVLIPALLDKELIIPLEFKLLQAADLTDWAAGSTHAEFNRLLDHINELLAMPAPRRAAKIDTGFIEAVRATEDPVTESTAPLPSQKPRVKRSDEAAGPDQAAQKGNARKQNWVTLALLGIPTLIVTVGAVALMQWRVPTRVQIDLTVAGVSFTLASDQDSVPIFDHAINFRMLKVENFTRASFSPDRLNVDDPTFADGARMSAVHDVVLRGSKAAGSTLTIKGTSGSRALVGRVATFRAPARSAITLAVHGGSPKLTIKVQGEAAVAMPELLPVGEFELVAQHVTVETPATLSAIDDRVRLRARLHESRDFIEVESDPGALIFTVEPAGDAPLDLLNSRGAPIAKIDLTHQGNDWYVETVLTDKGRISFLDYPQREEISVQPGEFLGLDDLRDARVTKLQFGRAPAALTLQMQGTMGHIRTRSGATLVDHRLTRFDQLWYESSVAILFSIAVWVFSVTLGAYRLLREVRGS